MTDVTYIAPQVALLLTAIAVLLLDTFLPRRRPLWLTAVSVAGLIVCLFLSLQFWGQERSLFSGFLIADDLSRILVAALILLTILTVIASSAFYRSRQRGDLDAMVLFALLGAIVLVRSMDLLTLFLALEIMSLATFVLCAASDTSAKTAEAALKFFLLGTFSIGFFVFGAGLLYGITGETNLVAIGRHLTLTQWDNSLLLSLSLGLLALAFIFEVAAVPFHMWAPDVFEGAPTPVVAFIATVPKIAAFGALLRLAKAALPSHSAEWVAVFWLLAAVTMSLGNLLALPQENVKRMLAYSSIAHSGYLLIGLAVLPLNSTLALSSITFYLLVYGFMNFGAFVAVASLEQEKKKTIFLSDCRGVGFRNPFVGVAMLSFMFSLAGIPPFAGFIGKFYLFQAGFAAQRYWLVLIAVINTLISIYFYGRVVVNFYMREEAGEEKPLALPAFTALVLSVTALPLVVFGLLPSPLLTLIQRIFS